MALIAELHRVGIFNGSNLETISRRMDEADLPDLALRVTMLPLSNHFDSPAMRRSTFHSIDGGESAG